MKLAVALYTRRYDPVLKRLASTAFEAALSYAELEELVGRLDMPRARVAKYFISHIGVEVPAERFQPALTVLPPSPSPSLFTRWAKSRFVSRGPSGGGR